MSSEMCFRSQQSQIKLGMVLIHDGPKASFQIFMQIIMCYAGGKHWKKGKVRKIGSSKY